MSLRVLLNALFIGVFAVDIASARIFTACQYLCHCPGWQDIQRDSLLTITGRQPAGRFPKL
jgi:hypothetical protein